MRFDNTKTPGTFKFASLGDIHLGHHNTPTEHIIKNLDRYCTNETVLKELDLLIITGDLFDRLLSNADSNVILIHRWITRLLCKCSYLNVKLRIVEGTPTHDRNQSIFFVEQKNNANINVDVHYASTLSVEYIDIWDCWILYVPDKWRAHTSDTLKEVKIALAEKNLKQVDFAIMHGAFEYQYPVVVVEPTHDSNQYLALVKHYILIGHVHLQTQYERILAAGSYDRLAQNEEGPKGYYLVNMKSTGDDLITFVENKGAKKYIAIDCHGLDIIQAKRKIHDIVTELPSGSAISIRANQNDPITGDLDHIKKMYPECFWSLTRANEKKKTTINDVLSEISLNEFIDITQDSILSLIEPDINKHLPKTAMSHIPYLTRLSEIIGT